MLLQAEKYSIQLSGQPRSLRSENVARRWPRRKWLRNHRDLGPLDRVLLLIAYRLEAILREWLIFAGFSSSYLLVPRIYIALLASPLDCPHELLAYILGQCLSRLLALWLLIYNKEIYLVVGILAILIHIYLIDLLCFREVCTLLYGAKWWSMSISARISKAH